MMPNPSRSHCTAAPVTKMAPSTAYATVPSASVHATVVSMPSAGAGHVSPTFNKMKLPVPYVFLAIPGRRQAWPKRAACWSPAMPEMGMPAVTPQRSEVTPKRPLEGITDGSACCGTPNSRHISSLHRSERMSKSIVRLALEASVACTSPPVRFHNSQLSMVPIASSSSTGMARLVSSHSTFEPEK